MQIVLNCLIYSELRRYGGPSARRYGAKGWPPRRRPVVSIIELAPRGTLSTYRRIDVSTYRRIDVSTYRRIDVSTYQLNGADDKCDTAIRRPDGPTARRPGAKTNRRGKQAAGGRPADRAPRRIVKKIF